MKTLVTVSALALLTSCANVDGIRVSAGLSDTTITSYGESKDFTQERGRIELVNTIEDNMEVGLVLGAATGDIGNDGIVINNYDVGFSVRKYFTESTLRPFLDIAGGYRYMEFVDDVNDDKTHRYTAFGSAGLGLQLQVSDSLSLFVSGGYEGTIGEDLDLQAPMVMVGGTVRF